MSRDEYEARRFVDEVLREHAPSEELAARVAERDRIEEIAARARGRRPMRRTSDVDDPAEVARRAVRRRRGGA